MFRKDNVRARLRGFGRAVWTHGRRAVSALDKGADVTYRFLSHLNPEAVTAVAGERATEHLQRLHGGLERYELARHRVVGPRRPRPEPEEVD